MRSGFRLQAPASLTPANRLKFMVAVREYLENFNEDIG